MRCFFSLFLSLSIHTLRPDYLLVCDVKHHAQHVKRTIELTRNFDLVITLLNSNIAWISDIFHSVRLCPLLSDNFRSVFVGLCKSFSKLYGLTEFQCSIGKTTNKRLGETFRLTNQIPFPSIFPVNEVIWPPV